ncbi:hypothetical protein PG985_010941 [Apiospora marii]|uniref:Uncharacterized protein n=1 Tax=Apiospora marii TaxID=335849 RepID=A0ABR1SSL2_9PEZI
MNLLIDCLLSTIELLIKGIDFAGCRGHWHNQRTLAVEIQQIINRLDAGGLRDWCKYKLGALLRVVGKILVRLVDLGCGVVLVNMINGFLDRVALAIKVVIEMFGVQIVSGTSLWLLVQCVVHRCLGIGGVDRLRHVEVGSRAVLE